MLLWQPVIKNLLAMQEIQEAQVPFRGQKDPWRGLGNPLQYSCLKSLMDRGAWQATVHRVAKSQTRMTQVSTQNVCVLSCLNHIWLFATLWTVVCQTLLSRRFFRQEYWSGLPFPPPGNLPNPGTERVSYVFCFARQIIYHWAIRQALKKRCIICIIGKCNRYLEIVGWSVCNIK